MIVLSDFVLLLELKKGSIPHKKMPATLKTGDILWS